MKSCCTSPPQTSRASCAPSTASWPRGQISDSTESANHVAVIGCSEPGSGHWQDCQPDVLNGRIFCHSLIQTLSWWRSFICNSFKMCSTSFNLDKASSFSATRSPSWSAKLPILSGAQATRHAYPHHPLQGQPVWPWSRWASIEQTQHHAFAHACQRWHMHVTQRGLRLSLIKMSCINTEPGPLPTT